MREYTSVRTIIHTLSSGSVMLGEGVSTAMALLLSLDGISETFNSD